jgi:hypothetical protein
LTKLVSTSANEASSIFRFLARSSSPLIIC